MKDDLAAAVLIVGCAIALYAFGGLAPLWGPGANRDASIWPFAMLVLLVVLGESLGVQSLRRSHRVEPDAAVAGEPNRGRMLKTLAILAYIPALFVLGFYTSALVYAFVLPPVLGGVRWRASAAFALSFTVALYLVFSLGLRMDLPDGYAALAWASSMDAAR
jgi:hypothetical protein